MSGPGLTLEGMPKARAEDTLPDLGSEFHETFEARGPGVLIEASEEVATWYEALVGALRAAVKAGLLKGCVVELEEIVLGKCI